MPRFPCQKGTEYLKSTSEGVDERERLSRVLSAAMPCSGTIPLNLPLKDLCTCICKSGKHSFYCSDSTRFPGRLLYPRWRGDAAIAESTTRKLHNNRTSSKKYFASNLILVIEIQNKKKRKKNNSRTYIHVCTIGFLLRVFFFSSYSHTAPFA